MSKRQTTAKQPKRKTPRLIFQYFMVEATNAALEALEIRAGDIVWAEPTCAKINELVIGELVVVELPDETSFVGLVAALTAEQITISDGDRGAENYPHTTRIYRAKRFSRDIEPPCQRQRQRQRRTKPAAKRETERRLAALRRQLNNLDDSDITTCSARFALEKQIYDLERELDVDEWPDVIDV